MIVNIKTGPVNTYYILVLGINPYMTGNCAIFYFIPVSEIFAVLNHQKHTSICGEGVSVVFSRL